MAFDKNIVMLLIKMRSGFGVGIQAKRCIKWARFFLQLQQQLFSHPMLAVLRMHIKAPNPANPVFYAGIAPLLIQAATAHQLIAVIGQQQAFAGLVKTVFAALKFID